MFRRDFFKGLFGGAAVLEFPEVTNAEILRLEPCDTIVVTLAGHASMEEIERIKALVEDKFPSNRVLVKESAIDISVIKG